MVVWNNKQNGSTWKVTVSVFISVKTSRRLGSILKSRLMCQALGMGWEKEQENIGFNGQRAWGVRGDFCMNEASSDLQSKGDHVTLKDRESLEVEQTLWCSLRQTSVCDWLYNYRADILVFFSLHNSPPPPFASPSFSRRFIFVCRKTINGINIHCYYIILMLHLWQKDFKNVLNVESISDEGVYLSEDFVHREKTGNVIQQPRVFSRIF